MTGDEYVELLLQRQRDYVAEHELQHGVALRFPPLLEWFIREGDEELFTPPVEEPQPQPKPVRAPRPRRVVDIDALKAKRDALIVQRDAIAGSGSEDRASTNLSPHCRNKAAARAGRRRFEQMDRDLEKWCDLHLEIGRIEARIALESRRQKEVAS